MTIAVDGLLREIGILTREVNRLVKSYGESAKQNKYGLLQLRQRIRELDHTRQVYIDSLLLINTETSTCLFGYLPFIDTLRESLVLPESVYKRLGLRPPFNPTDCDCDKTYSPDRAEKFRAEARAKLFKKLDERINSET